MKTVVLINACAGPASTPDGADLAAHVAERCRALGVDAEVRAVHAGELAVAIRSAVADPEVGAVVVGGGDGTISTGAALLAGTGKPLGVLPLGTLNHFARDLGLPGTLDEALSVLARGAVRRVDVGEVNGRTFVNNCSLGLYVEAVRQRERLRHLHGWAKWTAMAHGAWSALRRFRIFRLTLRLPERERRLRTPQLVVGNNRYETDLLKLGRRPALDAGELWVYSARDRGRFGFLRLALLSLVGRLDQQRDFEAVATPAAEIVERRGERRLFLALDGELTTLHAPLRFRCRPGALAVLAPPPADA